MMKKILITGGAGFIGSAIVNRFKKNNEIYVIDDLTFGSRSFIDELDDNYFFQIDILDEKPLKEIIKNISPDWVLHLAAVHFIPYCNEYPFKSAKINIQGTINLLEAIKSLKSIRKVLFASTAAVYPIIDHAIDENEQTNPLDIYGLSKLTGEHLFREYYLETKIPTIICRFFNAFGPNETNPHLIPEIQQQINSGSRTLKLGNLEPKRDFIHTDDMSSAIETLLEKMNQGYEVFNLGRGKEYSIKEVVQAFETALGESLNIEQDPSRVRKSDRMHLLADISKIQRYTNWQPKWSLEQGVKTLINN